MLRWGVDHVDHPCSRPTVRSPLQSIQPVTKTQTPPAPPGPVCPSLRGVCRAEPATGWRTWNQHATGAPGVRQPCLCNALGCSLFGAPAPNCPSRWSAGALLPPCRDAWSVHPPPSGRAVLAWAGCVHCVPARVHVHRRSSIDPDSLGMTPAAVGDSCAGAGGCSCCIVLPLFGSGGPPGARVNLNDDLAWVINWRSGTELAKPLLMKIWNSHASWTVYALVYFIGNVVSK